jgi:hypothetical protein
MSKTTKAQLEEKIKAQDDYIKALEKKSSKAKTTKKVAKKTETLKFTDSWQLLTGTAFTGNQISLPPQPKANSRYTQNIIGKFAVPCTMTGLDQAISEIEIARNRLNKAGLLTQ